MLASVLVLVSVLRLGSGVCHGDGAGVGACWCGRWCGGWVLMCSVVGVSFVLELVLVMGLGGVGFGVGASAGVWSQFFVVGGGGVGVGGVGVVVGGVGVVVVGGGGW